MGRDLALVIGESGYPELHDHNELKLAGQIRKGGGHPLVQEGKANPNVGAGVIRGATVSGNPLHEPGTGRFGTGGRKRTGKPQVRIVVGHDLIAGMDQKQILSRAQSVAADAIAAQPDPQGVKITFVRQGVIVDQFIMPTPETTGKNGGGIAPATTKPPAISEEEWQRRLDAVRDAAREFEDLDVGDLREFFTGRAKRELTDDELRQLVNDVRRQRLDDLVDAIDTLIRSRTTERLGRSRRHVRVKTPRGWINRTFNNLSDDEVNFVLDRLIFRGFKFEDIQKYVVDVRLRDKPDRQNAAQRHLREKGPNARPGSSTAS